MLVLTNVSTIAAESTRLSDTQHPELPRLYLALHLLTGTVIFTVVLAARLVYCDIYWS